MSHIFTKNIFLYKGKPLGSENWTFEEVTKVDIAKPYSPYTYNVSDPTLTYFPANPYPNVKTDTAIIIAPGGGFQYLSIEKEGIQLARFLANKGIHVFLLKYRTNPSLTENPKKELQDILTGKTEGGTKTFEKIVPLCTADAITAMKYIRENANEYGINKDKIGFVGYSAGGCVGLAMAKNAPTEFLPNFIAPIYPYYQNIPGLVPNKQTFDLPIFIAVAGNDELNLTAHSLQAYKDWTVAGQQAELHIFEKGGHGFGLFTQGLPSDKWIENFLAWLLNHQYIKTI